MARVLRHRLKEKGATHRQHTAHHSTQHAPGQRIAALQNKIVAVPESTRSVPLELSANTTFPLLSPLHFPQAPPPPPPLQRKKLQGKKKNQGSTPNRKHRRRAPAHSAKKESTFAQTEGYTPAPPRPASAEPRRGPPRSAAGPPVESVAGREAPRRLEPWDVCKSGTTSTPQLLHPLVCALLCVVVPGRPERGTRGTPRPDPRLRGRLWYCALHNAPPQCRRECRRECSTAVQAGVQTKVHCGETARDACMEGARVLCPAGYCAAPVISQSGEQGSTVHRARRAAQSRVHRAGQRTGQRAQRIETRAGRRRTLFGGVRVRACVCWRVGCGSYRCDAQCSILWVGVVVRDACVLSWCWCWCSCAGPLFVLGML